MNDILIGKIASAGQLQGSLFGEQEFSGSFNLFELPEYQYEGAYEFTPSSQAQYAPTAYMTCLGDIKINPIPSEYIIPSGTKNITENGDDIDVTEYADVNVNVQPTLESITKSYTPTESSQTETVTAGVGYDGIGEVDITVNPIPSQYIVPSGTLSITENGTEDVTSYADVDVNVQPSLETVTRVYTPSNSSQSDTITASAGYDGIEEVDVTINAVPSGSFIHGYQTEYFTKNDTYFWGITPNVQFTQSGWINSGISYNSQIPFRAIPSGQTITPSTSSKTVGGASFMMQGAVTVDPIPSQYIVPSGTKNITSGGTTDVTEYKYANVPSVDWGVPSQTTTKQGGHYLFSITHPDFSAGYLDEDDGFYFSLDLETKSVTPTESSQSVTPTDNNYYLDSVTVNAIPSNYVGTGIPRLSQSDMTGLYDDGVYSVSVPSGYFSSATSKNVPNASYFQPTANLDINLSAHGVAITPIINITSSGYILSDLYSGSNQYIFASDLVTGTMSISANGTYDVTNYASVSLSIPDGDNLEYGITDGTLPLVGVAKAGYAEI